MENQKNRPGATKVTSVSLSKEFENIVHEYGISPTSAIRKGIAIELFDKGINRYQTDLNVARAKFLEQFEKDMKTTEQLNNLKEQIQLLLTQLNKLTQ